MIRYDYDKEVDVFALWEDSLPYEVSIDDKFPVLIEIIERTNEIRGFELIDASRRPDIRAAVEELGLRDEKNLAIQAQKVLDQVLAGEIALESSPW